MMQDLDADFRAKETEIMQHTNKVPFAVYSVRNFFVSPVHKSILNENMISPIVEGRLHNSCSMGS